MKCQAGGLQPYLKSDFDSNVYPVNVEEFSKQIILDKKPRQILEIKREYVLLWNVLVVKTTPKPAKSLYLLPNIAPFL